MSRLESVQVNRSAIAPERPAWQLALLALRMPLFLSVLCLLALMRFGFLVFHTLAEGISIIISVTALVVASTSLRFTRNHFAVFIAIAIGWCAGLDFIHLMVYKGMNLLPVDNGASTQYWIAARYIQAVGLLLAPLALRRPVKIRWLHLGFGGAVTAAALLISSGRFPVTYIEGSGLTLFKELSEYVIIGMMAIALLLYRENRGLMSDRLYLGMSAAVGLMILAEFSFSTYMDLYGVGNRIGHLLKIVAYWYVYLALVRSTLSEPFTMLARAASTYDAVPDPALMITDTGVIPAGQRRCRRAGGHSRRATGRRIRACALP